MQLSVSCDVILYLIGVEFLEIVGAGFRLTEKDFPLSINKNIKKYF